MALINNNNGHGFEYKYISPNDLKVDYAINGGYQRITEAIKVKRIVDNWNDDVMNSPKVSQRENGSYWIIDGANTTAAFKEKYGNKPILCKVFHDLTRDEEKELFLQQFGVSSNITIADKLYAEYNAGNPEVVGMVTACQSVGLRVEFGKKRPDFCATNAVGALYQAYKAVKPNVFIGIITVLKKAWDGQSEAFSGGFIKGMTNVFVKYYGQFSESEMAKSLAKHGTSFYIREAAELGGSMGKRYAAVFIRVYNKNRSSHRLEV